MVAALLLLLRPPGPARARAGALSRRLAQDSSDDSADNNSTTNWWETLTQFEAGDAEELHSIFAANQGVDMLISLTGAQMGEEEEGGRGRGAWDGRIKLELEGGKAGRRRERGTARPRSVADGKGRDVAGGM